MEGRQYSLTDVSFVVPDLMEILSIAFLQSGYNSAVVLVGTTLLGAAAGLIGTFALLRGRALMGDALAHSALPGIAGMYILAVLLGWEEKSLPLLLFGAAISGILGVMTVQFLSRKTRLTEETSIGAVLSVFFGVGVVLLSVIQGLGTGSEGGIHHFIYGQTAAMNIQDALVTLAVMLFVLLASFLFFKESRLVCFDSQFADVQGWPVSLIDLIIMALVVLVTVVGLQSVGMILIVALLIIPAAAARFWTERLTRMAVISTIFGALSGYLGSIASAVFPRLPTGAIIVLAAGALFFLSFAFAPARGAVGLLLRRIRLNLRVANEHFLRGVYELCETQSEHSRSGEVSFRPFHPQQITITRSWSRCFRHFVLLRARLFGWMSNSPGGHCELTERGIELARRYARNHRLWEAYMIHFASIPDSHVDISADLAEHVLSPEIVSRLEARLSTQVRLPPKDMDLPSPHSLEPSDE